MGIAKYQKDGDPRTSGPGFGVSESTQRRLRSRGVGGPPGGLRQLHE